MHKIAELITGGIVPPSPLLTDGYKFSMAQAGFPLREETFYLSFRRGGPFYIPFDLNEVVQGLRPRSLPTKAEEKFLAKHGYEMTPSMLEALKGELTVRCAPAGTWVYDREPILTITGPSFLVSWLEPLAIMLNFPIQVATAIMNGQRAFEASCQDEARIIQYTAGSVAGHTGINMDSLTVRVRLASYRMKVALAADGVRLAVKGDTKRVFEVGMRAASCAQMHKIALKVLADRGIRATSNVHFARLLKMIPVGTSGHEHQQRHGDDYTGFTALRDMRPGMPSYLPDTTDVISIGLPAAIRAIKESPRFVAVRFDSGDQERQVCILLEALGRDSPLQTFIFEDGYTAERTVTNEAFCDSMQIPVWSRKYGYGGYFVNFGEFSRDKVQAVYKLTQTRGRPVMKFCCPTKQSIPGRPVIFRRAFGSDTSLPIGVIGQEEEFPPGGYLSAFNVSPENFLWYGNQEIVLSPATRKLVEECK
jgi:nicotinic acid phosphoribosyltransferase